MFEPVTPAGHELASDDTRRSERALDAGFAKLLERMGSLEQSLLDAFERRIADSVTTQTRLLVFSQLAAVAAMAAIAFGLR